MTELDLTPIKQRLDAATDGPWEWDKDILRSTSRDGASVLLPLTSGELACDLYCRTLIASAPTDIAALIAEVERLRAEVESLESTLMEDY